jgi:hypothetical protein
MRFPTSAEKTAARRRVMGIVSPALLELGFTKVTTTEFSLPLGPDRTGMLLVHLPLHSEYYSAQTALARRLDVWLDGPHSFPYGCPNSPNGERYNFRLFFPAPDTFDRCAASIMAWVEDVAIPWFRSEPRVSVAGTLPWPNQDAASPV